MSMTPNAWQNATSLEYLEYQIRDRADKKTWDYTMLYGSIGSTDEFQEKVLLFSGLGLPQTRNDSEDIQSEDMVERGTVTLSDVELALGCDYSVKTLEDLRQKGLKGKAFLDQISKSLGESFAQIYSIYAALPLNRAFDSTNQAMVDDLALCDSHTTEDGTSVDNDLPLASLTFDTVWTMANWLRNSQYSYKGLRRRGTPKLFIYHPNHNKTVKKIFTQEWEPDTGNRNRNTVKDFGITPLECIELNDTGDKFMVAEEGMDNWVYKFRKRMKVEYESNKRNRTESALAHCRILVGVKDYPDFVGIPGT